MELWYTFGEIVFYAHKVKQNLMKHNQCKNLKSDVELNLEIWFKFFSLQKVKLRPGEF